MSRCTERDLRHGADPERFGKAMLRCQNASGDCMTDGYCIYGNCFSTSPEREAARAINGLIPNDGRAGMYYAYLRKCAEMLRSGHIHL